MKRNIFKRKIYEKMLEWKQERNGSTALLLKGARRVGKSTVAKAFAKKRIQKLYSYRLCPSIQRNKATI